mmetsp:Transcript_2221/g.5574  ORF Transcript_2221/g.5574 Transcript_2221/m.5574 type:complete len:229 (+) Transcript_2221:175-861(+)
MVAHAGAQDPERHGGAVGEAAHHGPAGPQAAQSGQLRAGGQLGEHAGGEARPGDRRPRHHLSPQHAREGLCQSVCPERTSDMPTCKEGCGGQIPTLTWAAWGERLTSTLWVWVGAGGRQAPDERPVGEGQVHEAQGRRRGGAHVRPPGGPRPPAKGVEPQGEEPAHREQEGRRQQVYTRAQQDLQDGRRRGEEPPQRGLFPAAVRLGIRPVHAGGPLRLLVQAIGQVL